MDMRLFISHSYEDRQFADGLRLLLMRSGLEVWNPETGVLPGDNWLLEAGTALEKADGLVFLLSASSLQSASSRREVEYAFGNRRFEGRVISVLLGHDLKMPWILKRLPTVDAVDHDTKRAAREIIGIFAKEPSTLPEEDAEVTSRHSRAKRGAVLTKSRA